MGWDSRRYKEDEAGSRGRYRGDGGFRAVLRRIFGNGENPYDWALPLYTAWGIRVRIHLIFVVLIIAELLLAIPQSAIEWQHKALGMGGLFLFVLLHEYGHCIACRRVGGTADQILMWPLGGLAYCAPPHHWKADLLTTLGGPAVNALLIPLFGAALLVAGQAWEVLVFNPFNPGYVLSRLHLPSDGTQPFWLVALWWGYYLNLVLLCFNMLLVMYPMDAGRVLNALLWRSMGYRAAMSISVRAGMVVAVILFVFAVVGNESRLTGVALFGFITCYIEKRRLDMDVSDPALRGYDFERGYRGLPDPDEVEDESPRAVRPRERQRKQEEEDQAELDRILAKIRASGMASLTRAEKRWLERATERRRRR